MRLIDVNNTIKKIKEKYCANCINVQCYEGICGACEYKNCIDMIEGQPIVYNIDQIEEAQQKQVPKKPKMRKIKKYDGYNDGWCPTCGGSINDSLYDNVNHCWNCGQALDWSEEE